MEDDEYVFYGTSLPDIDDEVTLKKRAARELQVRDEKGRQRFHGAFTGGFSAGYFNTVGTKEGWAPSSFVSSRSKVAERVQQNPEDFMDDEDLGEFGIASRRIRTTSSFQDKADVKSHKRSYYDNDSVIPGEAPLKDIVQPVCESIGIQILRKLGWKQGQGIGPRIKRQRPGPKVYGCSLFPDATEREEEDPTAQLFTFAPQDTESIFYKPKDDYFGLGYKGLSKESVLNARSDPFSITSTKSFLAKEKKKIKISGQAFGVGAFENDDEDIYSKDDLSQYDFSDLALLGSKDTLAIEQQKTKKTKKSDEVIDGFCLGSKPLKPKKIYPPPSLPPNFIPVHLKSSSNAQVNEGATKSRHALSAPDRSFILGEKKFTQASFKDVAPIPVEKTSKQLNQFSRTSNLNFRPFPNDAAKQQRYESYLKLKEKGETGKLVQPSSMTEWEKQQEMEEFAKASVFFQPLNNVLSSRFESKSHLSVEHEVMSELEKLKKEKELKPQVPVKRKLIGISNRKSFEWHPVSLLCKRMNVPNPYPNESSSGGQSIIKSSSVFDHLSFSETLLSGKAKESNQEISSTTAKEIKTSEKPKNKSIQTQKNKPCTPPVAATTSNIPLTSENTEGSLLENTKPPIDFFKDIFANTSDEESENEEANQSNISKVPDEITNEERKSPETSEPKINEMASAVYKKNTPAPQKVGFGVFANLDLDALNERKAVKPSKPQNASSDNEELKDDVEHAECSKTVDDSLKKFDEWTPELPPNFKIPRSPVSNDLKMEPSHSEKFKSKHHHKHKHHKHKSKKKKKKKHGSSTESEDDIDDVPPTLIIQKLKELQKKKL